MPIPANILAAMTRPDALTFPENRASAQALARSMENRKASPLPSGTVWHLPGRPPTSGPRVLVTATGHGIVYGEHGQRILYVDPGGTPLHECAWRAHAQGPAGLLHARLHLDWGQWVGLTPEGLVNEARFDISKMPGWQRLATRDLQAMAAQALRVTPEEIAFFYDDQSLTLDARGCVTIRHRKDAFYILEDGTFAKSRFLACMGAMHWGQIDFLPVVELFQSLFAGTGSAVFELIRGLYDDQNAGGPPRLLRYRGIPTYPSPQAFQLFSTYFVPDAPGGADPLPLFMDPARSAQVTWRPRPDAPCRYVDTERGLCVTVTDGAVIKVTRQDDPAALPFGRPRTDGFAPGGRMVGATTAALQLQDGDRREELPLRPEWGVTKNAPLPPLSSEPHVTWRALFPDGAPDLDMRRAYYAVPIYPSDDTLVDDAMTQPLALEHTMTYLDQLAAEPHRATLAGSVLIHNWDFLPSEIIAPEDGRTYTVLYTRPEFAQRQAQRVGDQAAAAGHLASLRRLSFLPADRHQDAAYAGSYGMIYRWIPFAWYRRQADCERSLALVSQALTPGGYAVLAGPPGLREACSRVALRVLASDPIAETAGAHMHQAILPKARINPEATLYLVKKM
jgi:hypothetical protein